MRCRPAVIVVLLASLTAATHAQRLSRDEALAEVYSDARIEAERVFLTATQEADAAAIARETLPSALVGRYVATRDGRVVGRAYVDTHQVRSKRESLLISLDAEGQLLRIDVTAFEEPAEYFAPLAWLRQFQGRTLDDDLAINRAIRPIAGATLTARATTAAVRRALAIDQVLTRGGSSQ